MRTIFFFSFIVALVIEHSVAKAVTVEQIDSFAGQGDRCLTHHIDRYIWVRGKDADWKNRPFGERYRTAVRIYEKQAADNGFKTMFNGPWDRALVPVYEAQRDAIFDALLAADTTGSLIKGTTSDQDGNILGLDGLETYLRQNKNRKLPRMFDLIAKTFGAKKRSLDRLESSAPDTGFAERMKNTAMITAACAQLSFSDVASCVSATNGLLTEANLNSNLILPKIWKEVVRTKAIREGVRNAALIMIQRIKNRKPGRFFDDLTRGFQIAGLKGNDATDATWKLLALYGNGGANTGYRILAFDTPVGTEVLGVSLSFIGTAVTYLDFQQRVAGQPQYALPGEAVGSCLTPKPYHFWLSAYFARWLVKQGYSPEVAQSATFIVNKGYQVNRDLNNAGGGIEKLLSKPIDHPTNEVVRVDLALAAAGDVYGSLVDQRRIKSFFLESGLGQASARSGSPVLSKNAIVDRLASDRVKLIKAWDDLYQPNGILRFFQAQQK